MDREAHWAKVYRVTKSQTRPEQLSMHTHIHGQVSTSSSLYINIIAHLCYQKYHILYLILKLTFPTQIFSSSFKNFICYALLILLGI